MNEKGPEGGPSLAGIEIVKPIGGSLDSKNLDDKYVVPASLPVSSQNVPPTEPTERKLRLVFSQSAPRAIGRPPVAPEVRVFDETTEALRRRYVERGKELFILGTTSDDELIKAAIDDEIDKAKTTVGISSFVGVLGVPLSTIGLLTASSVTTQAGFMGLVEGAVGLFVEGSTFFGFLAVGGPIIVAGAVIYVIVQGVKILNNLSLKQKLLKGR